MQKCIEPNKNFSFFNELIDFPGIYDVRVIFLRTLIRAQQATSTPRIHGEQHTKAKRNGVECMRSFFVLSSLVYSYFYHLIATSCRQWTHTHTRVFTLKPSTTAVCCEYSASEDVYSLQEKVHFCVIHELICGLFVQKYQKRAAHNNFVQRLPVFDHKAE